MEWHWNIHLNGHSFWRINASATDSWAWRKLLDLRPLALQFCKSKLGNGQSTSFWYDVWTPMGQLITHIGSAGPRALRIRKNAVVKDAISGTSWRLPHPRSQSEIDLHAYLTTLPLPLFCDIVDSYDWIAGDSSIRVFRSSTTWEVLRPRQDIKLWADVVWFKGAIPKQSFTMWIVNYDRLPTRARLATWGLPISPLCPFCSNSEETRDHLLLSCQYSREIWHGIFRRCQPPSTMFTDWAELLSWIRAAPSARLTLLRKLAAQTTIYFLWKQRNNLIHNQISLPSATVLRAIDREVCNIISARRHRKNFDSLMVMCLS